MYVSRPPTHAVCLLGGAGQLYVRACCSQGPTCSQAVWSALARCTSCARPAVPAWVVRERAIACGLACVRAHCKRLCSVRHPLLRAPVALPSVPLIQFDTPLDAELWQPSQLACPVPPWCTRGGGSLAARIPARAPGVEGMRPHLFGPGLARAGDALAAQLAPGGDVLRNEFLQSQVVQAPCRGQATAAAVARLVHRFKNKDLAAALRYSGQPHSKPRAASQLLAASQVCMCTFHCVAACR
jgi:hypothetical protein